MPNYQFFARTEDAHTENLGTMQLRDDANARSFGAGIIRGLMHSHPAVYGRWTTCCCRGQPRGRKHPICAGGVGVGPAGRGIPP